MLTAGDHSDADENATEGSAHWHYLWRVRNHKRWRSEPWSSSGRWAARLPTRQGAPGPLQLSGLAASCFTELGLHSVWWEEGQHYSFPYYHCRCDHLGPEFDCSPFVGNTTLAPCPSRILAPTSDLLDPSEAGAAAANGLGRQPLLRSEIGTSPWLGDRLLLPPNAGAIGGGLDGAGVLGAPPVHGGHWSHV
ncbi:uncharacterized protein LOC144167348 [Haemaphysalis longicornis]